MRLSLDWLKEYIPTKKSAEEIADVLTFTGTEVDSIEELGKGFGDILVGEITKLDPHPNADRLQLATVSLGRKKVSLVCGATNIAVGQKVPVVLAGVTLPDGTKIEKTKIRGVESFGMLCSPQELGIGEDHSGILVLSEGARTGASLKEVFSLNDTVLDCDITPNRSDCFSIVGLAREVAAADHDAKRVAHIDHQIHSESKVTTVSKDRAQEIVAIDVKAPALCPNYRARVLRGVQIKESPDWLKARLLAVGVRPINSIVDSTNYVMMAYGQPLHAFDLSKIKKVAGKHTLIVRKAKNKEKLALLDGSTKELSADMLVIADVEGPIALAGVMGGEESAVSETTANIVIESAQFNGTTVRKAGQKLGIRTESLTRFEKGIDWEMTSRALDRAALLIQELAGGEILKGQVSSSNPKPAIPSIQLTQSKLDTLLGVELHKDLVEKIILSTGCAINPSPNGWRVVPPPYRQDLVIEEDLIEEVGRLYGYNKLTPRMPVARIAVPEIAPLYKRKKLLKELSVRSGYNELLHYSFYSDKHIKALGLSTNSHVELANPLSVDQKYLRTSLLPYLLETAAREAKQASNVSVFESGAVFNPTKQSLPLEESHWAAVKIDTSKSSEQLVMECKGLLESGVNLLTDSEAIWEKGKKESVIVLKHQKKNIAEVGVIQSLPAFKLNTPAAYMWLNISALAENAIPIQQYQKMSMYPAVVRDITITFAEQVEFAILTKEIEAINPLIVSIGYVGTFSTKEGVNTTIRITYRSDKETLTNNAVSEIEKGIVQKIQKKFKGMVA
ncbi:MAG: phenylalanine--tRNA ligase subunit beta [Candidatus Jacksonbacteria bacterium]|nr:phenylalanine--tRNA ligase subunit beta [Candidatus Jacksonbacteria bacterium]MBT6955376.1 phenylalanine--tRNA ligase subunit beta [Candidatus Jacksonbacteria bacterium]MBT7007996.1 phenylalanine--tRNA ligase subunit beta [Candidatus Jacksonbacteria bacterium]MBT7339167.1 phenylalanine--tRNA ligase subunit beta [Candidatus Jacksonbacteria bacterium]